MKFELKDFQITATKALLGRMLTARDSFYRDGYPASCCLASPTGSGKTIMVAAAIEAIFNGNPEWGIERDPFATVLWVSDSPSLNEQTINKFREATDLDFTLIETIENTFTSNHDELEPGHIYFLNRQKLASSGLLVSGKEGAPTFWQLLRRTINDRSVHLFMLYDEAHKGLGSAARKDVAGETITSRIIDGDDGKSPIPVIVGISATPKRFSVAMEGRSERTSYPIVRVSPADVQASGLLKDKIVLQAPTEGAAVYNIYLNDACKTLVQSTALWQLYCEQNNAPMVRPLMVIQVTNKVSSEKIRQICSEIYEKVPSLDRSTAFAHVISGKKDMHLAPYEVPYVEPQDVQRKSDIRVLFAKEAISTGWDCPRAEVIFSMRSHHDDTYIAQLIGRMVRTPLAESVNIEQLNSVSCFLPYFDPATVERVVKYLTDEGSDDYSGISKESGREIVTKPVHVEWDSTFGIDEVFTSIASRERAHSTSNYIDGLVVYATKLDENHIGFSASEEDIPDECHKDKAVDAMLRALDESIATFSDKLEEARDTVLHAKTMQVELKFLDATSTKRRVYEDDADPYAITNAKRRGDIMLSQTVTSKYYQKQYQLGKESLDINIEIAAAAAVPEIVEAVKQSAKTQLEKLTEEHDPLIAKCPTSIRNQFSSSMSKYGIPHTIFLDKPNADTQDTTGKKYPKHVVNDPQTHMAWFNLSESEDAVVMHELQRPEIVCWYRNPVGKTTGQSLRIPYRLNDDRKVLHPDFIFFEKVNGQVMPAIVDPHGIHLADAMPKLKGIVHYVEDFWKSFSRYWCVSDYKGQATYLDLKDVETRSVISNATDANECFEKCGKKYMDGPLSKLKKHL